MFWESMPNANKLTLNVKSLIMSFFVRAKKRIPFIPQIKILFQL